MSIKLEQYDSTLQWLLAQAGDLLGAEALPFEMAWDVQRLVRRQTRRVSRHGLRNAPPIVTINDGRQGHVMCIGLELQKISTPTGELRLVFVSTPGEAVVSDFYAIAKRDARRFYRYVRQLGRNTARQQAPLLADEVRTTLWNNTVGWFARERSRMLEFDLPQRRGVLLLGSPGNGKTMACRWLRSECLRRGLEWNSITRQQYECARTNGSTRELFELDRPGVILFDDFEAALRDRARHGDDYQSTFLTELDGMHPKQGVVYVFTSNLAIEDIDPAARRPGRVDIVLNFLPPDATLRRRLIEERWHRELVAGLAIDQVVEETAGLSFAELEEARKLLVLHYLDHGVVDWDAARTHLQAQRETATGKRVVGFGGGRVASEAEVSVGAAARLVE